VEPSVTVIIPARNAAQWLPESLGSIGEGPAVAEILVVNDQSTDTTAALLAAWPDRRLRVLDGPARGPSAARNLALAEARAPLIAFLDADDRWLPGKLAAQLALHHRHPDIGFSFTDYRHVGLDGEDRGGCFEFWPRFAARHAGRQDGFLLGDDALAQIFAENVVGTSTVMARTDLLRDLRGFGEALPSAEDWELWLRLAQRAPVGAVPQILADYRMDVPGAASRNQRARVQALRIMADRFRAAAMAQDPGAAAACDARILVADAELAEAEGRRAAAAWFRLRAALRLPSRRLAREAAAALLRLR
jgi:glycosyltransferase involved in cell wall biosynthesis